MMDHLPLPHNPTHVVEVPCLSAEDYDGGDFNTFPDRHGWGPRTWREWKVIFKNPLKEFLAFLQTWLFFGPMSVFFSPASVLFKRIPPIRISDFSRRTGHPDRLVITTARLPKILKSWCFYRLGQADNLDSDRDVRDRQALQDLSQAWSLYHGLCISASGRPVVGGLMDSHKLGLISFMKDAEFTDPMDPRITMSIGLLLEFFMEAQSVIPPTFSVTMIISMR
ncbi:hypothetical protein K440DRAFT_391389 [Wilcoxina mikolae CBS 423.85]|nr:hypothetical protein K440DRAFT_391389 [Wilcoxina mikolae CBS 423.85]